MVQTSISIIYGTIVSSREYCNGFGVIDDDGRSEIEEDIQYGEGGVLCTSADGKQQLQAYIFPHDSCELLKKQLNSDDSTFIVVGIEMGHLDLDRSYPGDTREKLAPMYSIQKLLETGEVYKSLLNKLCMTEQGRMIHRVLDGSTIGAVMVKNDCSCCS